MLFNFFNYYVLRDTAMIQLLLVHVHFLRRLLVVVANLYSVIAVSIISVALGVVDQNTLERLQPN